MISEPQKKPPAGGFFILYELKIDVADAAIIGFRNPALMIAAKIIAFLDVDHIAVYRCHKSDVMRIDVDRIDGRLTAGRIAKCLCCRKPVARIAGEPWQ